MSASADDDEQVDTSALKCRRTAFDIRRPIIPVHTDDGDTDDDDKGNEGSDRL